MSNSVKIKQYLTKIKVEIDPVIASILQEIERLDVIKNRLYAEIEGNDILTIYTNKAKEANINVSAAVKEYKMYVNQSNNVIKTLYSLIKDKIPKKQEVDELQSFLQQKAK